MNKHLLMLVPIKSGLNLIYHFKIYYAPIPIEKQVVKINVMNDIKGIYKSAARKSCFGDDNSCSSYKSYVSLI